MNNRHKVKINTGIGHRISPYLFMQFMEPLGSEDGSVEAGWNFKKNCWQDNLISIIRDELKPSLVRWGGIFTDYWKWCEGTGPISTRVPMINYMWGGIETNQIGVKEIIDFCQKVNSDCLMSINFGSDGRPEYIRENRSGSPEEAADLVSYCNDPDNQVRKKDGNKKPWDIKLWQIGNETSYPPAGKRFTREENAEEFLRFARAMKKRDPSIKLIGWGDTDHTGTYWAENLLETAGEYVDYIAIHNMNQKPYSQDTILKSMNYRVDRELAWEELLYIYNTLEPKIKKLSNLIKKKRHKARIAITEGHLSLQPHNRSFLLHEWLAALYHAKVLLLYERHSDIIKIATIADFFGNRWTVNAVMLGKPGPYLMPAGRVMSLFGNNIGKFAANISYQNSKLDLFASQDDDTVYLHVINTDLNNNQYIEIEISDKSILKGEILEIAPSGIDTYIDDTRPGVFNPVRDKIEIEDNRIAKRNLSPASIAVIKLLVREKGNFK